MTSPPCHQASNQAPPSPPWPPSLALSPPYHPCPIEPPYTLTTLHNFSPSFHESPIAFISHIPIALDPYTKYSCPPRRAIMGKLITIDSYFKRKSSGMVEDVTQENKRSKASTSENFQPQNEPQNQTEKHIYEFPKPNNEEVDLNFLERDPGKQKRMFEYPANKKEEVRLAYLNKGPFQIHLKTYPAKGSPKRPRRFQYSWFGIFPNWLGYSPTTNAAYCFVCYLFSDSPNVRKHIRKEVGDSYFCIMVDEARDESKEKQMAIVLRFVDKDGFIRERFLDLVHVYDTMAVTLKANLWEQLLNYEFDISKIRGQGYDGASNMRGEWNGLQALVAKDCPYAYYVHCFAHRLQLALVAASKEVIPVHQFFTKLTSVVNVICASSKRHDELQKAKSIEIEHLLELGEIKTGKGANQIGTLRRAGDTRWGSHFNSVCSLFQILYSFEVI
ncbi:zinc finger MYM-type protein 1-like protein [Tanacetum coccineum]